MLEDTFVSYVSSVDSNVNVSSQDDEFISSSRQSAIEQSMSLQQSLNISFANNEQE